MKVQRSRSLLRFVKLVNIVSVMLRLLFFFAAILISGPAWASHLSDIGSLNWGIVILSGLIAVAVCIVLMINMKGK